MTIIVTTDQLQPILRKFERAAATAVTPMDGGSSSPVFRIDLASGDGLVLKTYPENGPWTPRKEAFAAAQLSHLDIPTTQYLMLDESRTRLPFRFAITNYMPGVRANTLGDRPGIADIYRQMGALLRKLHTVAMPAYGQMGPEGIANPLQTNAEFVSAVIRGAFQKFLHFGGDPVLAGRLRKIVDERFDAIVTFSAGPVFAHDDLQPGNILVTEAPDGSLSISGLIDFGNARAADPVFDLAKSLFCSIHEAPTCAKPLLEGYGAIDHPAPQAALWYYTLLHRMIMWWWLRHVGIIPSADTPSGLIDDLRDMANVQQESLFVN